MRNFIVVLCLAGALAACNQSTKTANVTGNSDSTATTHEAASVDSASAPAMQFQKTAYDFGKIKTGDKVSYTFKFTNTGKSPLIISDAVASCGCTKPEFDAKPIAPGQDGEIKVTFNSAGKDGLQDKMVTITANTFHPQNVVHLTGEVTKK
ncbi:DUF1573 domain-containing protein [Mucilaginibacter sp. Bleaf8]|uniref:DUF1573 domain-containing protein n=1 Tax=Mucilaginibacter sp. Bleaf8 TaxID=2834430 RepID=UPI001BCDC4B5|nr:DUF1573 domain-containing protein [Mucilaginibacter sp. Bleaf8]MBS7563613.1 DUF1573 domain-containing protein [Mucilaginibacter sp. Bleaf8]